MVKRTVFVSYASEDLELANDVRQKLQGFDVAPWQDVQRLRGGDDWDPELARAIGHSIALIVLVTKHSCRGRWLKREWQIAKDAGARVIPVLMEKVKTPGWMKSKHWVDLRPGRQRWARLADALNATDAQKDGPRLVAKISLAHGEPEYVGEAVVFQLRVKNAPAAIEKVVYTLHDRTLSARVASKSSKKKDKAFKVRRHASGDVLISATMSAGRRKIVVRDRLYRLLRRAHGKHRRSKVAKALTQIKNRWSGEPAAVLDVDTRPSDDKA